MNQDQLQRKLIAAAKAQAPDERVPFAFEKRIMARLEAVSPLDAWSRWGQGLWRAAVSSLAVALLLGTWAWFSPANSSSADLSQDFEHTLLAVADQDVSAQLHGE